MPIHVTIAINDRPVKSIHIARMTGGSGRVKGVDHEYSVVVQKDEPRTDEEWDAGLRFTHTYGTGMNNCVRAALDALEEDYQAKG